MIYLEVFPAFIIYVAFLGCATLFARHTLAGKQLFPVLWRSLVASTIGIIGANVFLWSITVSVGSFLTVIEPASDHTGLVVPPIVNLLLHPAPLSLAGCAAGIAVGSLWAYLAKKQPPDGSPTEVHSGA